MADGLIYTTTAMCTTCRAQVPGRTERRGNEVVLVRECPDHGISSTVLSSDAEEFQARAERFHKARGLRRPNGAPASLTLHLTDRCNLECPICFNAVEKDLPESTLERVAEHLKKSSAPRVALFGGEPLVRSDIDRLIALVREAGREPVLYTNGLRLYRNDTAAKLKKSGLAEVHIQFDGFSKEASIRLRGVDLVAAKLKAVDAARDAGLSVVLEVTCTPQTTPEEIEDVLAYAVKRTEISGINLRGVGISGLAREMASRPLQVSDVEALDREPSDGAHRPPARESRRERPEAVGRGLNADRSMRMLSDDVAALLERASGGRITRKGIDQFEATVFHLEALLRRAHPTCLRNRVYPVLRIRENTAWRSTEELFPLHRILAVFDRGVPLYRRLWNGLAFLARCLGRAPARLVASMLGEVMVRRRPGLRSLDARPRHATILIGIAGICEVDTYDSVVSQTCPSAFFDGEQSFSHLPEAYTVNRGVPL
jgi:pyruvate-formate lyase-activating enzyme